MTFEIVLDVESLPDVSQELLDQVARDMEREMGLRLYKLTSDLERQRIFGTGKIQNPRGILADLRTLS